MHESVLDVKDELTAILKGLDSDPYKDNLALQYDQLDETKKSLDKGLFPTFSQMERLEELLSKSASKLRTESGYPPDCGTEGQVRQSRDGCSPIAHTCIENYAV